MSGQIDSLRYVMLMIVIVQYKNFLCLHNQLISIHSILFSHIYIFIYKYIYIIYIYIYYIYILYIFIYTYIYIYIYIYIHTYRYLKIVIHQIDRNEWLLLSARLTAKFELVFVLTCNIFNLFNIYYLFLNRSYNALQLSI